MPQIFDFSDPLAQLESVGLGIKAGTLDLASGTLATLLTGSPHYSEMTKDFNTAVDYQDTASWTHKLMSGEATTADIAKHSIDKYNQAHQGLVLGAKTSMAYSGNMNNVHRPSQLMAIADPATKLNYARSGALGRRMMRRQGQEMDLNLSASLNPGATATGSGVTTSGGGHGVELDRDRSLDDRVGTQGAHGPQGSM